MDYALHLIIYVLLFGMVALSLNVASGFTQLITLCHASFFGIGAYTTAILSTRYGWPLWINLPVAMGVAAILALLVALVVLRTVDDYFIICTLGMGVIFFSMMNNWMGLTRGPLGINAIPAVSLFGYEIKTKCEWLFVTAFAYTGIFWIASNLKRSPLGRVLVGISEDEIFCLGLGKNVRLAKLQSFVLGAVLAVVPGVLYAHYISYIDPTSFTVSESIFVLSIMIIGGMGNLWGCLASAGFMILMPELLRFVGMPSGIAANVRQILYGSALMVAILIQQCKERSKVEIRSAN